LCACWPDRNGFLTEPVSRGHTPWLFFILDYAYVNSPDGIGLFCIIRRSIMSANVMKSGFEVFDDQTTKLKTIKLLN
jgi:hypothetical protein